MCPRKSTRVRGGVHVEKRGVHVELPYNYYYGVLGLYLAYKVLLRAYRKVSGLTTYRVRHSHTRF